MSEIEKEEFAFDLYNQLMDEFSMVDDQGSLARRIQESSGNELDNIIRILQRELLINMQNAAGCGA